MMRRDLWIPSSSKTRVIKCHLEQSRCTEKSCQFTKIHPTKGKSWVVEKAEDPQQDNDFKGGQAKCVARIRIHPDVSEGHDQPNWKGLEPYNE